MTAVSTLIRKVQSDPRYPRYLQALLDGGISMETAVRAAAVRIESEDKEDKKWGVYIESRKKGSEDKVIFARGEFEEVSGPMRYRMPGQYRAVGQKAGLRRTGS